MSNTIRVITVIVDTQNLTLYTPEGEAICIPQGSIDVSKIIESIPKIVSQGYADIELFEKNTYIRFQEESNSAIRFFRVAKDELKRLFDQSLSITQTMQVVSEITANAKPVHDKLFHEEGLDKQGKIDDNYTNSKNHSDTSSNETIIAVTKEGAVIPGVEKIKTQLNKATQLGSTIGVETFLKRIGAVIGKRKHSIDDLLSFMERGDLPIADDGSILIYKILIKTDKEGIYVDYHTKNVEQWVGAYVCMDEKLVDPNRKNECSNGLHVARRGYLNQFSGDVCVLAKVNPEDVIAVPEYDANKMRVCGYHIIDILSAEDFSVVRTNKPMNNLEQLTRAVSGNHIGITDIVKIGGQSGSNITNEKVDIVEEPKKQSAKVVEKITPISDQQKEVFPTIEPKQVNEVVTKLSTKQQIQDLISKMKKPEDAQSIIDLKRKAKKAWDHFGIDEALVNKITELSNKN